jgi:hypothetical protein
MELNYNPQQLNAAAQYLYTLNSDLHESPEEAKEFILRLVKEYAFNLDTLYVNSGGVQVCFSRSESFVEFYVDPIFLNMRGDPIDETATMTV